MQRSYSTKLDPWVVESLVHGESTGWIHLQQPRDEVLRLVTDHAPVLLVVGVHPCLDALHQAVAALVAERGIASLSVRK